PIISGHLFFSGLLINAFPLLSKAQLALSARDHVVRHTHHGYHLPGHGMSHGSGWVKLKPPRPAHRLIRMWYSTMAEHLSTTSDTLDTFR
ncbi:MAG: hypothetical protein KAS54_09500, partial [Dehalococcoidia bacterium]|nr:hypothetical protein [Dehalococcoidia bacterium]